MMTYDDLMMRISTLYSSDGIGERTEVPSALTLGIVVDTDDPLQMGRLRIFCPTLNDNPKKIHHLPWAIYISPFGGSINNSSFTRGHDPANCTSQGATQYGFWGIPEQGAHVLVGCVDGDPRRRFYIGTVYEHQEVHGVLTGRWNWGEGGSVDGPLTSDNTPLEPLYTNLKKAFVDNSSPEWKTRAADYQAAAVRSDVGEIPNSNKGTYLDQQYDEISESEQHEWVKPILGAHGYDWSGHKGLGSFMSSRVYGYSTPSGHTFIMDDRPFNSRVKFRSAAGHQIILDDTNERIYINTGEGNSWIEMDSSGNIDVFSERRISIHAKKDINFTTDETFRVSAKKGIHLYAGDNHEQEDLGSPPEDGEIRIQSEADMHLITRKNFRKLVFLDSLSEIGGNEFKTVGESVYTQVQKDIHTVTNDGDYNLTVSGGINELVEGDTKRHAIGVQRMSSDGDTAIFAFDGKMDIGSQTMLNLKSISEDITLEAVGANEEKEAGVFIKSPESQYAVSSGGVTTSTNKDIRSMAASNIEMSNAVPEMDMNLPIPPLPNIEGCEIDGPVPTQGYSGIDLATRAAYNAGFRGDSLVMAVAIAGGESSYRPGAIGDGELQNEKWGPSVGFWQIRTLRNPEEWQGVDRNRNINLIGGPNNYQNNANMAFQVSDGGKNFKPWTVYTHGIYKRYLDQALAAVTRMCSEHASTQNTTPLQNGGETSFDLAFSPLRTSRSVLNSCYELPRSTLPGNAFVMTNGAINLRAIDDIGMKAAEKATKVFDGIVSKINETAIAHNILTFLTNATFVIQEVTGFKEAATFFLASAASVILEIKDIVENPEDFIRIALPTLPDINLTIDVGNICSYDIPDFDPPPSLIFFGNNFDTLGESDFDVAGSTGSVRGEDLLDELGIKIPGDDGD